MSVMRKSGFDNIIAPGLRKVFFEYLKGTPTEYSRWINEKKTSQAYEDDHIIGGFGTVPQKLEGASVQMDNVDAGDTKRYTPLTYGLGFSITMEMKQDDLYGVMSRMTQALKRSFRNRYEVTSASLLNNCTSTGVYAGLDSVCLLSTAHTVLGGGSNLANKPSTDCDISQTAVEAAILAFHALTDEQGMPVLKTPSMAIVSGADQFKAAQIFGQNLEYGTGDNNDNWVKKGPDNNGISNYLATRYLTDTDRWFILADKSDHHLNLFERMAPTFDVHDDFSTGNSQAKGVCRIVAGHSDWRGVYGSTGG